MHRTLLLILLVVWLAVTACQLSPGGTTVSPQGGAGTSPKAAPAASPKAAVGTATGGAAVTSGAPAGWRTLTDTKYGFSISVPPTWMIQFRDPGNVVVIDPPGPGSDNPEGDMYFVIHENMTLEQFMQATNASTGTVNRQLYRRTGDFTVPGATAGEATYGGCCGGVGRHLFVQRGTRLFEFSLVGPQAPPGQLMRNQAEFDQIVQTLRFNQADFGSITTVP